MTIADEQSSAKNISKLIRKIGDVINGVGRASRRAHHKDCPNSLDKVKLALKDIGQSSLRSKLKTEDRDVKEVSYYLQSLESLARNKWAEINKRMEINQKISAL